MLITGIKKFDTITGGIPESTVTMLIGPANIGKFEFCENFILEGLKQGEPVTIVLTRDSPKDIINKFEKSISGFKEYMKKGMVKIIDCYTEFIGLKTKEPNVSKVSGPSDLTSLSLQLFSAFKYQQKFRKPIRCVFHALSTLFLYNTPENMLRFFTHMTGMVKTMNVTLLFTIEKIIGEEMAHKVSELVEGIVEFKVEREMFLINPSRLGKKLFAQWIQYRLTEKGIELL
jgi:KaiC/GvpD/RAD55 family RecA-like ATPase